MSDPRPVLAEYFVTERATVLQLIRADLAEPAVETIPLGRDELHRLVRDAFASDGPTSRFRALDPSAWVEPLSMLIEPVTRYCEPGDVVWLVPHDMLHYVPMHALDTGEGPLIERNPVCYSPSASVMRYCQAKVYQDRRPVLVYADTRADAPLVHARGQADVLTRLFDDRITTRIGPAATISALARDVADHSDGIGVLHLSCHGFFTGDDPLQSGLLMAPEPSDDGRLTVERIMSLRLPAELITLSACESGVSDRHAGDELIGLTRALIYAGAAGVVVSLWAVDDLSTSMFMGYLYSALSSGVPRAQALRTAQVRLRGTSRADVVEHCRQALAATGNDHMGQQRALLRGLADTHYAAGDFATALEVYERIDAGLGDEPPEPWLLTALARTRVALRHLDPGPVDYGHQAYAHPYYWAPFILVGDWR
ncbi:CHAT domain-containing protein [Streptomyces sp. NPDC005209]|uniref:CHAT domain-containing protein n=1 Tax=Streptomyces sp. NPDC005209 TaxID=3156715 RepID=UPI0033A204C3